MSMVMKQASLRKQQNVGAPAAIPATSQAPLVNVIVTNNTSSRPNCLN